ncbi:MAG: ABC transporter permease [Candidatus Brocadiia bacterium]
MLPDSEMARIAGLPQVAEIMPVRLIMTSCQSESDIIAMHGVDKEIFTDFGDYKISQPELQSFREDKSGALVGNRIAARYSWRIGQNVILKELGDISFNVRGIFTTDGTGDDSIILVDRKFLQEATDSQGISNRVIVHMKPNADSDALVAAIQTMPSSVVLEAKPEKDFLAASLDQLTDLINVSRIIIGIIIIVILLAVGNAISMATRDRYREFGVMRTLGFGPSSILMMVLSEGIVQAALGAVIGCVSVYWLIAANVVKPVSTCGLTVNLSAGTWALTLTMVAIIAAGAAGSFLPALNASRLDIVKALGKEE